ncbi:hypothetical protein PVAND_012652 [Polypedilum vanderplanki]|uniref:MADF domain-containing protein n=1 Tax=Polypedilum vanderplanki TaxID=319348 RepID=A0A9J6CNC4_POLVA|nr:hypothetical protein PVAND_012652 [Polypedilum vanderplanki]
MGKSFIHSVLEVSVHKIIFMKLQNKELCDDSISNLIETLPLSETLENFEDFFPIEFTWRTVFKTKDEDIFQLITAKYGIPFKLIKSKFDNMKRQYRRYIREERQLKKWMSFYCENEAHSNILHISFKSDDVEMQKNKNHNTSNGIKLAPSTEIQMDIDAEILTKSSNLTQPSEIENDQNFISSLNFWNENSRNDQKKFETISFK